MHCTKCGKKANPDDQFCGKCGKPLGKNDVCREQWAEFDKTFKAPGILYTKPDVLASNINAWLAEHQGLRHVRLQLQIDHGQVRGINLSCKESKDPALFSFQIAVITAMPKNWFGAVGASLIRKSTDTFLNPWRESHPNAQIITERVVTMNSVPSEIWILYRQPV